MIAYLGMGAGSQAIQSTGGTIMSAGAPLLSNPATALPGVIVEAVGALTALVGTFVGGGCGPTCPEATNVVNQAEPVLKQNLQAFLAGQIDKTTALSNFDQVWQSVVTACNQIPAPGGRDCIKDRQQGGKWDWFAYYRNPIASTPDTTTASSMTNMVSTTFSSYIPLIGVGLLLTGLVLNK